MDTTPQEPILIRQQYYFPFVKQHGQPISDALEILHHRRIDIDEFQAKLSDLDICEMAHALGMVVSTSYERWKAMRYGYCRNFEYYYTSESARFDGEIWRYSGIISWNDISITTQKCFRAGVEGLLGLAAPYDINNKSAFGHSFDLEEQPPF